MSRNLVLDQFDDKTRRIIEREHEALQDHIRNDHHVDPDDLVPAIEAAPEDGIEMYLCSKVLEEHEVDPDDAIAELLDLVGAFDPDKAEEAIENVLSLLETEKQ